MSDKVRSAIISLFVVLVIAVMLVLTINKFRYDRQQAKIKAQQDEENPLFKNADKIPFISDRYKAKETEPEKK